jgi:hypothetical protein
MSEDLLHKLQMLEEDYPGMPSAVRQADLLEINRIRSELGMPLVDAGLNEIGADAVEEAPEEVIPEAEVVEDHTEARAIYQAYRKRTKELEAHRAYAEKVAKATEGLSMTPVRPLATMGTDGGPLLCDYCKKPIVLEGGRFHGVTADEAWRRTPNPEDGWVSYILGGMVVEIQTNGTLRIYHGYPQHNDTHCCNAASREDENARAAFNSTKTSGSWKRILAFIEHEFPEMTEEKQNDLLNDVMNTVFEYDPGIGVNRPSEEG